MYELTVKQHFSAAHFIPGYPGKCSRLHGHNWEVELTVAGEELDELGILLDFSVVKKTLKEILERFDHFHLNEIEPFPSMTTTAENVSRVIFQEARDHLRQYPLARVLSVRVWESPGQGVLYRE